MAKETKQMKIVGSKYNTQKKYMQTMGVFDDWMKEKNYTVQDIMNQKIPFIHTEFMTWLTRTRKTNPSSAIHHASILNTMLSLIFGTVQVSTTVQRLTTHAIFNHQINNPRYGSTCDIIQLFEYWREGPENKLLSNEELQIKLASLLMSLCFVRMEEMAYIDLSISIIDDIEQRAAVLHSTKTIYLERDMMQGKQKTLEYIQQKLSLFGQQVLENTSNKAQRISYIYFGLKIEDIMNKNIPFTHIEFIN
ncbi:MAG: hypothetical protein EZS28_032179 [Streblomastix strix]|uniref:Integrase SAM-like N-terminal domain-containing protein n=1 Tax=Streblomastix strix TaxID=222440 RepID=A0A5J4UQI0_9EUKA|nr:MAG: hypothetical protein EZS28_032179 [Streblomastix strix]